MKKSKLIEKRIEDLALAKVSTDKKYDDEIGVEALRTIEEYCDKNTPIINDTYYKMMAEGRLDFSKDDWGLKDYMKEKDIKLNNEKK